MIEIDRSKCKKMLVWDDNVTECQALYVVAKIGNSYMCCYKGHEHQFESNGEFGVGHYKNAKPLPNESEAPKPMTALDAMWWASKKESKGHVIVNKHNASVEFDNTLPEFEGIDSGFEEHCWNELIRENGETKLKYDDWKSFTFDECDMGEG